MCCSVDINLLDFVFDCCVGKCMGGEGKRGGRAVVVRIQIRCRSSRFPPSFLTPQKHLPSNPPTHTTPINPPPLSNAQRTIALPLVHWGGRIRNSHLHPPYSPSTGGVVWVAVLVEPHQSKGYFSALKVHSSERFLPPMIIKYNGRVLVTLSQGCGIPGIGWSFLVVLTRREAGG